jgi:hypothetical protein
VERIVVPNCQRLQKEFRPARGMIVFTAFGSLRDDGLDMPQWAREDNALSRRVGGKPMYPCATDPSWQVDDRYQLLSWTQEGETKWSLNTGVCLDSRKRFRHWHTPDSG